MRRLWLGCLLLAGCDLMPPEPEPFLARLRDDPEDTEAMAQLAIIGNASVPGLIKLLDEGADHRSACLATLSVTGELSWPKMMDAFDTGSISDETRRDLLAVFAANQWRGPLRKLVRRLDHPRLGEDVYFTVVEIMAPQAVPGNPWEGGQMSDRRMAEWNNWMGRNSKMLSNLEMRGTAFPSGNLALAKNLIEGELEEW